MTPFNLLLTVPFVVGLLVLFIRGRRRESAVVGALGRYHQRAGRWRKGALAVGLAAALVLVFLAPYRSALWLAPVFGACVLTGVLVGELLVSRPDGAVRTAVLTPRRVRDYLPPRYGPFFGTILLVLTAVLSVLTSTVANRVAGPPFADFFRFSCSNGAEIFFSRWEVLSTVLSALVSVVGGAFLCLLVVRKVVNRPAVTADQAQDTVDNALRAASAEAVILAWGFLMTSSLLASALVASSILDTVADPTCNNNPWLTTARAVLYLLVAGSVGVLIHLMIRLTRLPEPPEAAA